MDNHPVDHLGHPPLQSPGDRRRPVPYFPAYPYVNAGIVHIGGSQTFYGPQIFNFHNNTGIVHIGGSQTIHRLQSPGSLPRRPAMASADDYYKVWKTRHLTDKPSAAAAAAILDKIAKRVRPIMRRHGWRVKLLSEFCPSSRPTLRGQNYNRGVEVRIRLRHHGREWKFIPYEQVLNTMLHELCHNAITQHNAEFYTLLDQLRKECRELAAVEKRRPKALMATVKKGRLKALAAAAVKKRRQTEAEKRLQTALAAVEEKRRQTALAAAAEKRRRVGDVSPVRANWVGGDSGIMKALTPVQAAAMAAEKRMMAEKTVVGDSGREDVGLGSSSSSPITEEDMDNQQLWECSMCTLFNKACDDSTLT